MPTKGPDRLSMTYDYNLQNRLEQVTKEYVEDNNDIDEITEYTYNPDGIRVKSYYYKTINDGAPENEETKIFLIDSYNHTGYAQVLEQWSPEGTTPAITYTIGDDVITQATSTSIEHLLYDGHGSTRQTVNNSEAVTDAFSYDAYGVLLGNPATTTTNLLYTGEMYDSVTDAYYLRARYYSPSTGRFNRMDPFSGNTQDPQSLHKYLYVHNNPVNSIDPSGQYSLAGTLSVIQITGTIMSIAMPSLITLGAAGNLGAVLDTPPDAFVVSVSASYIFKSLGKGFGGMGLEGTYEMLYINALGRWQDYGSIGWTAGSTGGLVTLEAGPVWNVKKVGDYENLFFSATYGGAPFDLKFPGLSQGGMGVTVFWSPMGAKARGFKMGPIASTGMRTGSGTISNYTAGGPFSMGKDVANWLNDNIPAPNLTDTLSVERLINSVKEKLNPLPQY